MAVNILLKLQQAADRVRVALNSKGFYEFTGTITPIIPGDPNRGHRDILGTPVNLNVGIEVKKVSETTIAFSSGVLISGDIEVTGVSRLFVNNDAAQTEALVNRLDTMWYLTGPGIAGVRYSLVLGQAFREDTEWRVKLRKKAVT